MKFMRILNFTVVMTPDVTGGYVVTCPALPGLVTEGDTLEEARAMATDAIQGYLESLKKDGEPIPTDADCSSDRFQHDPRLVHSKHRPLYRLLLLPGNTP